MSHDAIDLARDAIKACLLVGGPILLVSLVIGLLMGVAQSMTQIQDQTVSLVPKLLGVALAIGLCLPWLTDRLVDFSRETLSTPLTHLHWNPSDGSMTDLDPAPSVPPTMSSVRIPENKIDVSGR